MPQRRSTSDTTRISPSLHWTLGCAPASIPEPLIVEEPLAIEVCYKRGGSEVRKGLGITMRTPGNDRELALGFLRAEGLLCAIADVAEVRLKEADARGEGIPAVQVALRKTPGQDLNGMSRSLLTTSACGLCGRSDIQGLPIPKVLLPADETPLDCSVLAGLPEQVKRHQPAFGTTGGSHGAGLFGPEGNLLFVREDVGRHNAVDKVVGAAMIARLNLTGSVLVLSGRASFELIQKAAVAGIGAVVAVGAPSSAAVDLAHAAGITLTGFTREHRLNAYTHLHRLRFGAHERSTLSHDPAEALSVR